MLHYQLMMLAASMARGSDSKFPPVSQPVCQEWLTNEAASRLECASSRPVIVHIHHVYCDWTPVSLPGHSRVTCTVVVAHGICRYLAYRVCPTGADNPRHHNSATRACRSPRSNTKTSGTLVCLHRRHIDGYMPLLQTLLGGLFSNYDIFQRSTRSAMMRPWRGGADHPCKAFFGDALEPFAS